MARSTYIYLIYSYPTLFSENRKVVGAFTIKREAVQWAMLHGWGPHNADLSRLCDGLHEDKAEVNIDWPVKA